MSTGMETAIARYKVALEETLRSFSSADTSVLFQTLLVRDEIASLIEAREEMHPGQAEQLAGLDGDLKSLAERKSSANIDWAFLRRWRETLRPGTERWWWKLDESAAKTRERYSAWSFLTGLFFAMSIALTTDTFSKLKQSGPSLLFIAGTLVQSAVTLISGIAITEQGRAWLMKIANISGYGSKRNGALIALAALAVSLLIWVFLPRWMGAYYFHIAQRDDQRNLLSEAVTNYEYAIQLDSSNADIHFLLAVDYDRSHELDKAVREYEQSIHLDQTNFAAYNNLSRLYNLRKDYGKALTILKPDLENTELKNLTKDKQYYLQKNRGWANLGLKNYNLANLFLRAAIAYQPDAPSAHYLLGAVYGAQADHEKETEEYRRFRQLVSEYVKKKSHGEKVPEPDWEAEWEAAAQEALREHP